MFQEAIAQYLKQNHYESIQLKSVLFDMDGVLFDSMPYHAEAWHKTMKAHGLNLSREEAYMHEGRTGAGTINIVCQRQLGRDATQEEIESISSRPWLPVPDKPHCWIDSSITFRECFVRN